MRWTEIFEEEELKIADSSVQTSTINFLAKMSKKEIDKSYPEVVERVKEIKSLIKNMDPGDQKVKLLKSSLKDLNKWLSDHPLTNIPNPAGASIHLGKVYR